MKSQLILWWNEFLRGALRIINENRVHQLRVAKFGYFHLIRVSIPQNLRTAAKFHSNPLKAFRYYLERVALRASISSRLSGSLPPVYQHTIHSCLRYYFSLPSVPPYTQSWNRSHLFQQRKRLHRAKHFPSHVSISDHKLLNRSYFW